MCTRCLLELEKGEVSNTSQRELLGSSSRRVKSSASRLKKIGSGKVWDRSTSFNEPYKQSPAVTEKLSKCRMKTAVVLQFRA